MRMNKSMFFLFLILISSGCISKNKINENLKKELDGILVKDQIFREYIDNKTSELRKQEISKLTGYLKNYLDKKYLFSDD